MKAWVLKKGRLYVSSVYVTDSHGPLADAVIYRTKKEAETNKVHGEKAVKIDIQESQR